MITNLALKNFKVWKDSGNLELRPITVFFGANNSGKSSILQSLLMLKRTAQSPRREIVLDLGGPRDVVNLGEWSNVIHEHDSGNLLEIALQWELLGDESERLKVCVENGESLPRELRYELAAGCRPDGHNYVQGLKYSFRDHAYGVERANPGQYKLVSVPKLKRKQGRAWPLPRPLAGHAFPQEAVSCYQDADFLAEFGLLFQWLFSRVYYVGPLRSYPQRAYRYMGGSPESVGPSGEDAITALLAVVNSPDYSERTRNVDRTLVGTTNRWLERIGVAQNMELRRIGESQLWELAVRTPGAGTDVLITDVGFGVAQVLPIVVQSFLAPKGATVLFEQPEIHLHPAVQARLADMFVEAASKARGAQFIIESHSEHFLRRLQLALAEERIHPQDIAVYFMTVALGSAKAERLQVNEFGEISNWPTDFFGNVADDLKKMTLKRLRRKRPSHAA